MSEIEKSMNSILSGAVCEVSNGLAATGKVIQAAEILNNAGFGDDADIVLGTLKEHLMEKQASAEEEIEFEVTI